MRRVVPLATLLVVTAPASAGPLDDFGMGGRTAAMAGAGVATVRGAEAAHHNPAGVAFAEHPSVLLGYGFGAMRLNISGRDAQVLNARGTTLGVALPLKVGQLTLTPGLALYLPDQFIARIQLIPPTEPHFIRLDNDPHRLVVEPVLGVRIGEHLSLGAGVSLLGDARGNGITFNVGVVSEEKVGEAALDASLPPRAAPLLGAMVDTPRVKAGLVYRGELSLDLALDIIANVDVAGVVTGDALVTIRANNYFTPQRVVGGVAVDVLPDLTLTGELAWENWSAFPSGLADLKVLVALDITPPLVQTDLPPANFEDIVIGRVGAEYKVRRGKTEWSGRAGYAFLPSPVPEQVGLTSFADNDRDILTAGVGLRIDALRPYLTRPVELSVALQWHHLRKRLTVKDASSFPGEAFSSSGNIFHLGTSMTMSF